MGAQGGFGVSFLEDIPSPVGTTLSMAPGDPS